MARWSILSLALIPVAAVSLALAANRHHDDVVKPAVPLRGGAVLGGGDKKDNDNAPPPVPDSNLVTALYRVGLQPENLAAASVDSTTVSGICSGVATWLVANAAALDAADQALFSARSDNDRLIRLVRSGLASQADVTACSTSVTTLATADATRQQLLSGAFTAGAGALSSDLQATLTRIKTNHDAWGLPLQYCLIDRTQVDWVHVRQALANETIAAKINEDPDAGDQTYLSQVRADSAVSAAKTSLDTNLGAITAAFNAAVAKK